MILRGWRRAATISAPVTPRQLGERGLKHFAAGRLDAAESDFRQARALDPGYAEMPYNLALLADARGEHDLAVELLHEAIALRPDLAEAHFNLGCVLAELDDPAGAVVSFGRAESLGADFRGTRIGLGWAYYELEQFDFALQCFERVLAQAPEHPEARLGRSFVLLKLGRYAEGFADFESRFDTADMKLTHRPPPGPPWRGEDPAGKTVLVLAEQGFGDTLQFARYAPLLAARGARVVLLVQPPLRALAATLPGVEVFALGESPPPTIAMPRCCLCRTCSEKRTQFPRWFPTSSQTRGARSDGEAALPLCLACGWGWYGRETPTASIPGGTARTVGAACRCVSSRRWRGCLA